MKNRGYIINHKTVARLMKIWDYKVFKDQKGNIIHIKEQ